MLTRGTTANSKTIATMKKLFTKMMFVAVAAMGITACQNEPTEINVSAKKITVEVIGEMEATRSSFGDIVENGDADYYPSQWDGGESVQFSLNEAALVTAENTGTGNKATFSVALTDDSITEGTIFAFSPKGVYDGSNAANCKGGFTGDINKTNKRRFVVVPTEQSPTATSVDPAVHLLAGKATYSDGLPSSIKMKFSHVAAYGRMELTNFAENVTKVKISASEALAGTSCYYYYAGESEGQLTNADRTSITINNPAEANKVFWFGCAPADLSGGSLEVKVYTADATYTKTIDLTKRKLAFEQGLVSQFKVNMSDASKDEEKVCYTKVTSTADAGEGTYLIVYEAGSRVFNGSLGTLDASMNYAEVTITDNTIESNATTDAMAFTIAAVEGGYTIQTAKGYYIGQTKDDNGLKVDNKNAHTNTISFNTDGSADIVSGGAYMRYNASSGQDRFRYYKSSTYTGQKAIALYKKIGESGGNEGGGNEGGGDEGDEPTDGTTTATITFGDLGYGNGTNMWELSPAAIEIDANTSVTFYKGSNRDGCKYYTSGTAVRCYGGAYFTVSSTKTIVSIELVYGNSDGSNTITIDCGTFNSPTWTGESGSVEFTIGGTSGNRRIAGIKVTYKN